MNDKQKGEIISGAKAFVIIIVTMFPASYLMLGVSIGWYTLPVGICLFIWFAFLISWISVCHDRYKRYKTK